MVLLQKKLFLSKNPEGASLFPGVGGPNANFYSNPYNLWFSRGLGPLSSFGSPQAAKPRYLRAYQCLDNVKMYNMYNLIKWYCAVKSYVHFY